MRFLPLLIFVAACSSPTAPAVVKPPAVGEMDYAIHVPVASVADYWKQAYPDGVRIAPYQAQQRWDYSAAYCGSPNVYFGGQAPAGVTYVGTGIVIAPIGAASSEPFEASQWPGIGLEGTYYWVGRFEYTPLGAPGTYRPTTFCP